MIKQYLFVLLFGVVLGSCSSNQLAKDKIIQNPVLAGFYPDPSICKVGEDYYMVNSSFGFFPGLPIFHSKNLADWNQIGHVLDRPEQLNLDSLGISHGIYAPTLRYNETEEKFYLVCTVVYGIGNFVVTADKPQGPWSIPTALPHVQGIDPDIFFDTNGKAYISSCCPPPNNKPLYSGHRSIRLHEFDTKTLTTDSLSVILVNGGSDIKKEPVWCEGPHIFKRKNYYYLICAEGGTGYNHSEVVFRAETAKGPYVSHQQNPILTQRHLSSDRSNPITNSGHADFVQTSQGEWWSVFLACRPYVDNHFNTGRETFMAPVKWENDWPIINPDFDEIQYTYPAPSINISTLVNIPVNGNFTILDDFSGEKLNDYWYYIRTPKDKKSWIKSDNNVLHIRLAKETLMDISNPAFIGRRQQHTSFEAITEMHFSASGDHEKAGMVLFQNEAHHYFFARTMEDDIEALKLYKAEKTDTGLIQKTMVKEYLEGKKTIWLKIIGKGEYYSFYYATIIDNWKPLIEQVPAMYLSTDFAGGFVGTAIGLHATGSGTDINKEAFFNWFSYTGNDSIFVEL